MDKSFTVGLLAGIITLMSTATPAFSQAFNQQQQYYNALQQSAIDNAKAQDAWATHTVPGWYPGGYNDGTKSYNLNGTVTPNGYGNANDYNRYHRHHRINYSH